MLFVIAIMALGAALILPNVSGMLRGNETRTAVFTFQNQLIELRAEAYRTREPIVVVGPGEAVADEEAERQAEIGELAENWTYRLTDPVTVSAGGVCSPAAVEFLREGVTVTRRVINTDCGVRDEAA